MSALGKLQSVPEFKDPALDFLKTFKYDLGNNDLVKFGADEYVPVLLSIGLPLTKNYRSFDAGQQVFERYNKLISKDNLPFVRADSSERVRE